MKKLRNTHSTGSTQASMHELLQSRVFVLRRETERRPEHAGLMAYKNTDRTLALHSFFFVTSLILDVNILQVSAIAKRAGNRRAYLKQCSSGYTVCLVDRRSSPLWLLRSWQALITSGVHLLNLTNFQGCTCSTTFEENYVPY